MLQSSNFFCTEHAKICFQKEAAMLGEISDYHVYPISVNIIKQKQQNKEWKMEENDFPREKTLLQGQCAT